MIYQNISFPKTPSPYYFSNFVSTIDGKTQVLKNTGEYWPLGSLLDYQELVNIRSFADVLIHGKNTALGHKTVDSLSKKEFLKLRKLHNKTNPIVYIVISNNPSDDLATILKNDSNITPVLVTSQKAKVTKKLEKVVHVIRLGKEKVDLALLDNYLKKNNYRHILVEGGPHLMGSFFKENLIHEVFLTIAPKIVGNEKNSTLTMAEGILLSSHQVKRCRLLSVKKVKDELFLRYKVL